MPGPVMARPHLPAWADPANASVFDLPGQGLLRKVVGMLGLDDPNQVMAFGTPLETGPMTGGVLDAVAAKFPRFAKAIKAFHGSPHDFEKFDTAKIGTGEGAQAYGHGLYFAENPRVAEDYKNTLSGRVPVTIDAASHEQGYGVIDPATKEMKWFWNESEAKDFKRDAIGKTYEVAIHADPEHFLDWDKPLSQQSEKVQKAVAAVRGEKPAPALTTVTDADGTVRHYRPKNRNQATGAGTYESLVDMFAKREDVARLGYSHESGAVDEVVSQRLKDAGIPGIKYLDQGSRSAGNTDVIRRNLEDAVNGLAESKAGLPSHQIDGIEKHIAGLRQNLADAVAADAKATHNYVIFDAAIVDIMKKYGLAAPAAAELFRRMQDEAHPQDPQQ